MSNERPLTPDQAYTLEMRRAHAEQHIEKMSKKGTLEEAKSRHVANTYGPGGRITEDEVKAIKARFRNELSFGGDGK